MAKLFLKIVGSMIDRKLQEKGLRELSSRSSVVAQQQEQDERFVTELCDSFTKSFKGVTMWTFPFWLMWFVTLPVQLLLWKMCDYSWVKRTSSRILSASVDALMYTYQEGPNWFFQVLMPRIFADLRAIPSFVMALVCGIWDSIIDPHFLNNVQIRIMGLLFIFIIATLKNLRFRDILMAWWFIGVASLKCPVFLLYVVVPLILHKPVQLNGFRSATFILVLLQLALLY